MFYEESKITKLLKCQKCEKRYDEYDTPRILPCGKTVCNECTKQIISVVAGDLNTFECEMCLEEHNMPKKEFPLNEILASLILEQPNEVYRSKESEQLKSNLVKLETLLNELSFDMDHGVDKIKEHCIELRIQVQLAVEHKIQEINEFNDAFIKKIDLYEKECSEKLAVDKELKQSLETVIDEVKKFLIEKREYLCRFQISEEEIAHSNEKSNDYKSSLEFQKMNIKSITFNNRLLEFEINKNRLDEMSIGFLHFKPIEANLILKQKLGSTSKFISGSYDETIKVWDLDTRRCLNTLQGHFYAVVCLQMISNDRIISGSNDRTIKIWDIQSGTCITTLRGHSGYVTCLQIISSDRVISGSSDKTIRIWDIHSGQCTNTIQAHNDSVSCLELLSNERVISGSYGEIKIWNIANSTCISTLNGNFNWVRCLQPILNDRIISGGGDNTIKIWDIYSGQCVQSIKGHSSVITCLQLISNETVISGSSDSTIKLWNIQTGECIKTLNGHSGCVWSIQLISNDRVISCSHDKTIKIWNLNSGQCIYTMIGHNKDVTCLQLISNEY